MDQILEDHQLSQSLEKDRKHSIVSLFGSSASLSHLQFPRRGSTFAEASERERENLALILFSKSGDYGKLVDRQGGAGAASNLSLSMQKEGVRGDAGGENEYPIDESPFGPLKSASTRRTFAYLIAILNITYPDHDFSSLQPTTDNFHKIENPELLMHDFNSLMTSLGKKDELLSWIWDTINMYMDILSTGSPALTPQFDGGSRKNSYANGFLGSPRGDGAMSPVDRDRECRIYEFQPSDLSILEDMNFPHQTMWSKYWFIYNKKKKRVCFLYLSALNHMHRSHLTHTRSASNGLDAAKLQSQDERNDDDEFDDEYMDEDVDMDSLRDGDDDVIGDIEI